MKDVVLAASDQSQLCIRIPAVDQLILQRELYNSKNMKTLNTAEQREWKSTLVLIVLSYYNKKHRASCENCSSVIKTWENLMDYNLLFD